MNNAGFVIALQGENVSFLGKSKKSDAVAIYYPRCEDEWPEREIASLKPSAVSKDGLILTRECGK
jgi:hypothetical protein